MIGPGGGGLGLLRVFAGNGWWARQVSNLQPVGYEPTALPLSYGPLKESLFSGAGGVNIAWTMMQSQLGIRHTAEG